MNKHFAFVGLAAVLLGCSDAVTRPEAGRINTDTTRRQDTVQVGDTSGITERRLIECPTTLAAASVGLVNVLGGAVAVGGTSIALPAGAVLGATLLTVTVPASTYMEIDVTANNLLSFLFLKPVTITIDYSRCPASVTQGKTLTVWHINTQTKALLENMHGVNDPVLRRISFSTDHLSGYAIAQ